MKKKQKAFTLIELLVVASIIVILMGTIIINYEKAKAKSRDAKRKSDVSALMDAIVMYKLDNGDYPGADGYIETHDLGPDNESLAQTLLPGKYIDSIPMDPLAASHGPTSAVNTTYTGYEYYRYEHGLSASSVPPADVKKCGVFASLELPSADDFATISGPYEQKMLSDLSNKSIYCSSCDNDHRQINFALTK